MTLATVQAREEPNGSQNRVIKRRKRVPVSCEPCRPRKLKCDRQRPCQNCIARETPSSCWYKQGANGVTTLARTTDPDDVRSRMNRLESLVISLMPEHSNTNASTGSTDAPERYEDPEVDAVHSRLNANKHSGFEPLQRAASPFMESRHTFIGESKWDAVLRDIAVVKEYLTEDSSSQQLLLDDYESESPALLINLPRAQGEAELHSLPSRAVMDQLVFRFFNAYDAAIPVTHIMHKPTFLKKFEQYQSKLSEAPMIWLGLLYSIFCLALQSYGRDGDEPVNFQGISAEVSDVYRKRAAQCILIAGLSTTSTYSLETLVLYVISEYSRLPDGNAGIWMVMGLLVRKAMHLGLHRDPRWFPGMSPFESEVRRRLWISISHMDLLLSFQLGLPSMIRCHESDVEIPRNVYEEELYEEMNQIPPSRPPNEPTLISFIIAKQHLFQVFAQVVDYLNRTTGYSYRRVVELNKALSDAKAQIPPYLQMLRLEKRFMEPSQLFLQRLQLQIFYDKTVCVLNRRFLIQPETCLVHKNAQKNCIQSALSLISIQARMQDEGIKWYHFSLTNHDFILAAVIICLILYILSEVRSIRGSNFDSIEAFDYDEKQLLQALTMTKNIWSEVGVGSADAFKALKMIDFMLEKIETPKLSSLAISALPKEGTEPATAVRGSSVSEPQPRLGTFHPSVDHEENQSNFDWTLWDSMIRNGDFDKLDNLWLA